MRERGMVQTTAALMLTAGALTLAGCQANGTQRDPRVDAGIPPQAQAIAQAQNEEARLLHVSTSGGHVYYVGDGALLATVAVAKGDRVYLHEDAASVPAVHLLVNEEVVYTTATRSNDDRLYFLEGEAEPADGEQIAAEPADSAQGQSE